MNEVLTGFLTALWLGILTSISPCPLATNIAAVSFLSKKIEHQKAVLWSGICYTLGRAATYAVLGFAIIYSVVSVPVAAIFLQKYMNKILGPLLLLTGLYLIGLIKFQFASRTISDEKQKKLADSGLGGAFILGLIFALSFCPISAALYFGSLMPLSFGHKFGLTLPLVYGVGTALPVLVFAMAIAFGVKSIFKWFGHVTRIEVYARKFTGAIFILAG
ncbi:MAG: aromatic aminobenezylarsenical efflux permease ArsG family transporter, partial [Candidatus Omnitrophica bacterium]|nr:aromatic aminobenezylarsenical efflux permease ArsG family transporter [Candidatus Omnitrophota bacterium]